MGFASPGFSVEEFSVERKYGNFKENKMRLEMLIKVGPFSFLLRVVKLIFFLNYFAKFPSLNYLIFR